MKTPKASNELNIKANRQMPKYSNKELFLRVLWGVGSLVFRLSPRPFFGFRNFILRTFGASIGENVHIYNSAHIYFPWNLVIHDWSSIGENALIYNLGKVEIGTKATISFGVRICAGSHDYRSSEMPLLKPPIKIGNNVWLCAESFIGPGVCIGDNSVAGARSVVMVDVPPGKVVAGNPARVIKDRVIN